MPFTTRPELRGTFGAVASTHWLASAAGMAVLERGGNAFDAAVAAGFTLQVVEPHLNGPGGDLPAVFWPASIGRPVVLCAQGVAPAAATIDAVRALGHDVVPGTYETFWFQPTELGDFQLECSEFCGTNHAKMTGAVHVLAPADYASWLSSQGGSETLAQQGEALFRQYGCSGCHSPRSTVHAPILDGLYGSVVHLGDGRAVVADERYIRDCILLPASERVAGYPPVMPSFAGQIPEDDLMKLVAYIQSLGATKETP